MTGVGFLAAGFFLLTCKKSQLSSNTLLSIEPGNYIRTGLIWKNLSQLQWGPGQIVHVQKANALQLELALSGRFDLGYLSSNAQGRADVDCSRQGTVLRFTTDAFQRSQWHLLSQKGECDRLGALKFALKYMTLNNVKDRSFSLIGTLQVGGVSSVFEERYERGFP